MSGNLKLMQIKLNTVCKSKCNKRTEREKQGIVIQKRKRKGWEGKKNSSNAASLLGAVLTPTLTFHKKHSCRQYIRHVEGVLHEVKENLSFFPSTINHSAFFLLQGKVKDLFLLSVGLHILASDFQGNATVSELRDVHYFVSFSMCSNS